ncbi:MAG: PEGA domain-containing protein [Colwellia sp.]|nr:PEGA domain-containing protein [Colwellia sp.]
MKNHQTTKQKINLSLLVFIAAVGIPACGGSSTAVLEPPTTEPVSEPELPKLSVSTIEEGSAIYLDGKFTGMVTPADISAAAGEHTIGIGLKDSRNYLKKSVIIEDNTSTQTLSLTNEDLQAAKEWKVLFVGVNRAQIPGGNCTSEYTTAELDAGFEFLKWSFEQRLEDYSYNTVDWSFSRVDIRQTITLNDNAVLTPNIIDNYLADNSVATGDYDHIITFYRGGDVYDDAGSSTGQECELGAFQGLGWYEYDDLAVNASYVQIRYWDNIIEAINYSKADEQDPGMFIHEWLHSVAEINGKTFFKGQGYTMPSSDGNVVHAAGAYNYTYPWMTWYKDIISGQVEDNGEYIGITPEAFLACSVREKVLAQCD